MVKVGKIRWMIMRFGLDMFDTLPSTEVSCLNQDLKNENQLDKDGEAARQ